MVICLVDVEGVHSSSDRVVIVDPRFCLFQLPLRALRLYGILSISTGTNSHLFAEIRLSPFHAFNDRIHDKEM